MSPCLIANHCLFAHMTFLNPFKHAMPLLPVVNACRLVMASKFLFNALKRLNTALRSSMAMGQVGFDSWLTIQAPLIVSHNRCTVSLKQWKKFLRCLQPLGL